MKNRVDDGIEYISNVFYSAAFLAMAVIGFCLIGYSFYSIYHTLFLGEFHSTKLLNSVSLAVIGIAIFDVGKYIWEEEILRSRESRFAKEARHTVTKFIVTILVVVTLEAVVLVFSVSRENRVEAIIYPAFLLICVALLLASLGVYKWMTKEPK